MKKMRVLFIASLVAGAFAANHTCTTTTTAKWVVGSAGKSTASNATTGKCWERDWCSAATPTAGAAQCADGTSTTQAACILIGVCYEKDKDGASTMDGATRCPTVAVKIVAGATSAALCTAAADYTPVGATAATTTGGVFVAQTWTAQTSARVTYRGSEANTITGTGTDAEWDTIRGTPSIGHCGCWDPLNTQVQAAGTLGPVTDCTTNSHSQRRYCSTEGSDWSAAMTYVQANKAVSPATSPVTYMSKTGSSSGLASDGPHFKTTVVSTCVGSTFTAATVYTAMQAQTTASALDWKDNYSVSASGACTVNATSTSPAAALSGIVAMFFALMAML